MAAFRRVDQPLQLLNEKKPTIGLEALINQWAFYIAFLLNVAERSSHLRKLYPMLSAYSGKNMSFNQVHEREELLLRIVHREDRRRTSQT